MESQTGPNENNPNFHNVSIGDELREQERNQAVGSSISDSSSDIPEDVKGFFSFWFSKILTYFSYT